MKISLFALLAVTAAVAGAAPKKDGPYDKIAFPDRAVFEQNFAAFRQTVDGEPPPTVDPELRFDSEEKRDGYTLYGVSYNVEAGDRVEAWLLVPDHRPGDRLPLMLCPHPTNAVGRHVEINRYPTPPDNPAEAQKRLNRANALDLVKRGYVCFAPDRPGYGPRSPKADHPNAIEKQKAYIARLKETHPNRNYLYGKVVTDLQRALDFLVKLDYVDPERIGTIGHSLGAWDSLVIIAMDPRVKAAVVNCGGGVQFLPELWTDAEAQGKFVQKFETLGWGTGTVPNLLLMAAAPRAVLYSKAFNDAGMNYDRTMVEGSRMLDAYYRFLKPDERPKLSFLWNCEGHDFPPENRAYAYRWLDRMLDHRPPADAE